VDASDRQESRECIDRLRRSADLPPHFNVISTDKIGRATQMNLGAGLACQPVLLFLHCDTRLPHEAANLIGAALSGHHCWGRFDIRLDARERVYQIVSVMINLRSRVRRLATGDQGIFVKREQFESVQGFPDIPLMEDIALSRSLKQISPPALVKKPVTTSARRWKQRGAVNTILLMWKLRFLFWLGVSPHKLALLYQDAR